MCRMSQQATMGRETPAAARQARRGGRHHYQGQGNPLTKGFKLAISEIVGDIFNTGQNCFAAQFTQSRKNITSDIQRTASDGGYLVVETIRTGKRQKIDLPPLADKTAPDTADLC